MKRLILILAMLAVPAYGQFSPPANLGYCYYAAGATWIPIASSGASAGFTPPAISLYGLNGTTPSKLTCDANGNLTPGGTAAGDLTGTYPNPTVSGLEGVSLPTLAAGCLESAGVSGPFSWTACAGATPSFSALSSGTNATAAMVVGTGASLAASGSGSITATAVTGTVNGNTYPASAGFTANDVCYASSTTAMVCGNSALTTNISTSTAGTVPLNVFNNASSPAVDLLDVLSGVTPTKVWWIDNNAGIHSTGTAAAGAIFLGQGTARGTFTSAIGVMAPTSVTAYDITLPGATPTSNGQILSFTSGGVASFTATPTLGASGTLGSLTFGNATSGTVNLQPVTGALGSVTVSLPAVTGTLAETPGTQAFGIATLSSGTVTVSNAAACTPSATCVYKLTNCALNGSAAVGTPGVGTISVGTSFVINSYTSIAGVAVDSSKICWQIN